jgi:hypothetical protein
LIENYLLVQPSVGTQAKAEAASIALVTQSHHRHQHGDSVSDANTFAENWDLGLSHWHDRRAAGKK